jgi:hypothetical protein
MGMRYPPGEQDQGGDRRAQRNITLGQSVDPGVHHRHGQRRADHGPQQGVAVSDGDGFCFFAKGKRIYVVSAYQKQGDKAPPQEIKRAENLRIECMERIARKEERHEKKQG